MMETIEQNETYLCLSKEGLTVTHEKGYHFFNNLAKGTIEELKLYFDCQPDSLKEHAFEYREQQIKTFITLALGKMTGNNFLQEFPMDRVKKRTKKREDLGWGFIDYWAATKEVTCFIEVKKMWIRYDHRKKQFTAYKSASQQLANAKLQTDRIKDKRFYYNTPNAFSLGLLITPIYVLGNKAEITSIESGLKGELVRGAKKLKANILAFWQISDGRLHSYEWKDKEEYYPGVVFWGKVKKISRG